MAPKIKTKASPAISIDVEERTIEVVMTTRDIDRDGDIVETKGIELKNYLENPVVLWAHNASLPPIGKILDIVQEDTLMRGTVKFASTPMAEEIFQLYVGGFLKTWSIGFGTKELDYLKNEDNDITGYHLQKTELYELSAVPVPANPEALVRACKGLKDEDLKSVLLKEAGYKAKKDDGTLFVEKNVTELSQKGELAPTAFDKSAEEAGAAGKIRVSVKSGEEASTEIKFDVVKRDGDLITEAKIKAVSIVLVKKADTPPLTPTEPSRSDETSEEDAGTIKSAEATAEEIRERAAMRMAILKSEQFCG
jgi:HK97 family phage prohead protease